MQDKIVLITGGNDGIGKQTAIGLAKLGATVVIACRNMDKATNAIKEIQQKSQNDKIGAIPLDLASFASIRACVTDFQSQYPKLDVLINNAGVFSSTLQRTAEGFEWHFGINHLGHFLLTHLLLPQLLSAEASRVINVSSNGHYGGSIDFDNLRGERGASAHKGLAAYAQSKLANVLFTREMARRYPQIISHVLHPGVVRTNIANKGGNFLISLAWTLGKLIMISEEKGAQTSIYLASSPDVAGINGQYFDQNQQLKSPSRLAQDDALGEKLWEVSKNFVMEIARNNAQCKI